MNDTLPLNLLKTKPEYQSKENLQVPTEHICNQNGPINFIDNY